jgi:hypothetical protein
MFFFEFSALGCLAIRRFGGLARRFDGSAIRRFGCVFVRCFDGSAVFRFFFFLGGCWASRMQLGSSVVRRFGDSAVRWLGPETLKI